MRTVVALFSLALLACGGGDSPPEEAPPARRPNVLLIVADDQGWGDLSVHGNANLETPNIDALARDGALFERFYVQPVCSPTRAEILTGRYHFRGGVYGTSAGKERLDLDERTIAEAFQAAGYATAAFGKWHNGSQHPYHPLARGFGEYYGMPSGHWAHYFDTVMHHNTEIVRGEGYIIDDLTNRAIDFIEKRAAEPFFVYVPYNTPHSPMQVPDRFYEKFDGVDPEMRHREPERESLPMTRAALAMVENIDWNVGRLLRTLEQTGTGRDTIVLYMTDNGPNSYRWNGGMKGRKGSTDEGGVRSPLLVRWPTEIRPGLRIPQIAAAVDLLPTLTELAGVERIGEKPLDGVSLAPLLLERGAESWPERTLVSFWNGGMSLRTRQYRMDDQGALYDMTTDPGQERDMAAERPEEAARLRTELDEWRRTALEELGEEDRPFTVGYADWTWLPARDATVEGTVERSNRFPNSSYFTNWTSPRDVIAWDIQVAEAGEYEVVAYYAVPEKDVGATIELAFLDGRLEARVTEAHDPPLLGAAEDRVERQESYTKDFRAMRLGAVRLEAGRGPLTLRAPEIPGGQAMEISALVLRRQGSAQ